MHHVPHGDVQLTGVPLLHVRRRVRQLDAVAVDLALPVALVESRGSAMKVVLSVVESELVPARIRIVDSVSQSMSSAQGSIIFYNISSLYCGERCGDTNELRHESASTCARKTDRKQEVNEHT